MAYGYTCIHCGRQETPHKHLDQDSEGVAKVLPDYRYSLEMCPGFAYSLSAKKEMSQKGLHPDGPGKFETSQEESR